MTDSSKSLPGMLRQNVSLRDAADHLIADLLKGRPSLDGVGENPHLVELWLDALSSKEGDDERPLLVYAGAEVLEEVLKQFGVEPWLQTGASQSRTRLHRLLDIVLEQNGRLTLNAPLNLIVKRLTDVIPGKAFADWVPLGGSGKRLAYGNALSLFTSKLSGMEDLWFQKQWPIPVDMHPCQIGLPASKKAFEWALRQGWDPCSTISQDGRNMPQWQILLDSLKGPARVGDDWREAERKLRDWVCKRRYYSELKAWEQKWYWERFRSKDITTYDLMRHMVSVLGWESLKDANGANAALVAVHQCPDRLGNSSYETDVQSNDSLKSHKVNEMLGSKDAQGRDVWYYILTSGSSLPSSQLDQALRSYPPSVDNAGQGWLDWLLLQPHEKSHQLIDGGGVTIAEMTGSIATEFSENLATVLEPSDAERQHLWLNNMLASSRRSKSDAFEKVRLFGVIMRLMSEEAKDKLLPELRYLGLLSKTSPYLGASTVDKEFHDLAIGGLQFGKTLRNKNGLEPWSNPGAVPEWFTVVGWLSDDQRNDLEIGWRKTVLKEVAELPLDDSESVLPRL